MGNVKVLSVIAVLALIAMSALYVITDDFESAVIMGIVAIVAAVLGLSEN